MRTTGTLVALVIVALGGCGTESVAQVDGGLDAGEDAGQQCDARVMLLESSSPEPGCPESIRFEHTVCVNGWIVPAGAAVEEMCDHPWGCIWSVPSNDGRMVVEMTAHSYGAVSISSGGAADAGALTACGVYLASVQ